MAPFVEGLKQQPPAVDVARGRDFCTVLQLLARLAEFSTVQFQVRAPRSSSSPHHIQCGQ